MQIERVKWMWSGAPFGAQLTPDQSTSYSHRPAFRGEKQPFIDFTSEWRRTLKMEGIYVSENGVWFDLKQHPTPWIPVLSKRRRRIVLGAQWQKRLENSKEKWRALQTGKKRKRLQAETWVSIKPDEVKQTPKDVLTQLAEENEDLRKTIEETPPIYIGRWRKSLPTGVKTLLKWETSSDGDI